MKDIVITRNFKAVSGSLSRDPFRTEVWLPDRPATILSIGSKLALKNYGFGHISVLKTKKNKKVGNLIKLIYAYRLTHKTAYLAKKTTF